MQAADDKTHSLEPNHGFLLRPAPSDNGTVPILLLQPRSQAGQQTAWALLTAPECPGPDLPACADSAIDPDLLAANLLLLAATNAHAGVQCLHPISHDSNGLSETILPEANHSHPGAPPTTDVRL